MAAIFDQIRSEVNEKSVWVRVIVSKTTFKNISVISWQSVLLVVISTDCIDSYKSSYLTITTTTAPEVCLRGPSVSAQFLFNQRIVAFEQKIKIQ